MKHYSLSKINWVAILTIILGGLGAAQQLTLSQETMGYIVAAIGVVNFILRTFFSSPLAVTSEEPLG